MNIIKSLLILLCIFIFSCGKSDKPEFVDDKPVTNNSQDKSENKNNSTEQNKSGDKTSDNSSDKNSQNNSQGNSNDKSFKEEKPVAVITALEANDYLGKTVTVKGFVADIYKSEKVAYLNFVEKYPENPFTAVIFANKFADFGDINKYKGKNVEVTGRVSVFNKKPQVILNSESQIKIAK